MLVLVQVRRYPRFCEIERHRSKLHDMMSYSENQDFEKIMVVFWFPKDDLRILTELINFILLINQGCKFSLNSGQRTRHKRFNLVDWANNLQTKLLDNNLIRVRIYFATDSTVANMNSVAITDLILVKSVNFVQQLPLCIFDLIYSIFMWLLQPYMNVFLVDYFFS